MKGNVTNTGYWPDSPDRNNDFNIIPSNEITMEGMDMPLMGISNKGDKKLMLPGKNYKFKGETVMETPVDKGMFLGKFTYRDGGLVRMDPGGPVNPNFKPSYDWQKSAAENIELNKRAEAAGHNSVDEYRASGWAWQPEKTNYTQGTGQGIRRAQPQAKSWGEKVMEIPKTPQSETSAFSNMNLKKMNQDLLSGSTPSESTSVRSRIPAHWVNNTPEGIKAIEADWEKARQEGIAAERARIQADNAELNKRKQQFAQEHLGTDISQLDNYEKDNNTGEWAPKSEHTKQLEAKGKEQSLRVASENAHTRNINTPTMEEGLIDLAKQAPLALIGAGLGNMAVAGETGVAGLLGQVGNNLSKGVAGAKNFVKPAGQAYNHALHAVMDKSILGSPLTLGRVLKADAAFQVGTDYIPHGIESAYNYSQTGDTDYLKAAGKDAAMSALNAGSYYGRAAKVIAGAKKPAVIAGYVKDALGMGESRDNLREYGVDNTAPAGGFKADSESTAVRNILPTPMITSEKNGGNISVPNFSRQEGGDMPFGLPLKEQNIYTLPEYNQPRNPKTGEILPDPRRPNLGMGTGATEYKTTIGYDEGDVDAPMIVSGQYVGPQGAIDRYELTGERFKTMTDPGSYSNFYEQIGELGLMQEKHGGSVKRVRIKSLPKNWKTQ